MRTLLTVIKICNRFHCTSEGSWGLYYDRFHHKHHATMEDYTGTTTGFEPQKKKWLKFRITMKFLQADLLTSNLYSITCQYTITKLYPFISANFIPKQPSTLSWFSFVCIWLMAMIDGNFSTCFGWPQMLDLVFKLQKFSINSTRIVKPCIYAADTTQQENFTGFKLHGWSLYHFVGLIFTDVCIHTNCVLYSRPYFVGFIFMVRW